MPNTELDIGSVDFTAVDVLPLLLVDDRPENLRALEAVLAPLGYPLLMASSGAEALRLLLEHDVALILLDVLMPGLDGLETAQLIKTRSRTRDIPIVFLTAARDEVGNILRGYGVGAVDYVLKPFDPELLRSKVAVFVELEKSRRALNRSETFLRAAFEAAPIGKTLLDGRQRIVRSNPAFARLVGRDPGELDGVPIMELCHEDDVQMLTEVLDRVAHGDPEPAADWAGVDLRLVRTGADVWVGIVASSIEPTEFAEPLLLIQWVDLSARRRAEQTRAELLLEHAARSHAESIADRLAKLQALSGALDSLSLAEVLTELALRLVALFDASVAEVQVSGGLEELEEPVTVRASGGKARRIVEGTPPPAVDRWHDAPLVIEGTTVGTIRLGLQGSRSFRDSEQSLLRDAAERAALGIRRAQLHEREHRIAVELQSGLLPKRLPSVTGVELAAHYQAAGLGAEVGGDWYDAFALPGGRLGVVLGDVAGRGVPAASAMGQLRSVTRAFGLAHDGSGSPGDVLTRLSKHQLALGQDEMFTVLYAIIDPRAGTISWANAGHPPPLLMSAAGERRYLAGGDGLMGFEDVSYRDLESPVGRSDVLVFYTDGLIERRGESLEAGLQRLAEAVVSGPHEKPSALRQHVLDRLLPAEGEQNDDVTAVFAKLT